LTEEIHKVPPSNSLDLHNFRVNEADDVVDEFLWSCKENGRMEGVIIHGKGKGYLRELVLRALERNNCLAVRNPINVQELANWGRTYFKIKNS
jgi:DNA-nicking Smr family endonuclease